ncbi:hypothetical protein OAF71_01855 [bacterium]|nr:hypothetical protein [bacterium]
MSHYTTSKFSDNDSPGELRQWYTSADRDVMTVAYESPDQPDLKLDTHRQTVSECADQIIELMTNQTILR